MTDKVLEILAKERAMEENMTPTGVRYLVKKVANTSLYCAVPDKGAPLDGLGLNVKFTSPRKAVDAIRQKLEVLWNKSNEVASKSKAKTVSA